MPSAAAAAAPAAAAPAEEEAVEVCTFCGRLINCFVKLSVVGEAQRKDDIQCHA